MMSKRCLGTALKALIGLAGVLGVASCSLNGAEYVSGRASGTLLTSTTSAGTEAYGSGWADGQQGRAARWQLDRSKHAIV
jgi:hypothetical protein